MASRAGIIVTGTEVLTGRVVDRNGPWLVEQLRQLGVDVAYVVVAGDRPDDLTRALTFLAGERVEVIITSGGLGPTADDLTAAVVADFQGRPMRLDAELDDRITEIVERLVQRVGWHLDPEATAAGTRKQAMVPDGATVLDPVGTAPGLVVPSGPDTDHPPVLVLPGPPRELQGMWPAALADQTVRDAIGDNAEIVQRTIRLWGIPEAELAATLRDTTVPLDDLEITTCLAGGELEMVTRFTPDHEAEYDGLERTITSAHGDTVFSTDGRTIEEIVADQLLAAKLTIATAESCTGGMLAARLTDRAGSSAYVSGGLVVYSNDAKRDLAGVPMELIERLGAVSEAVARALADGARQRLRADVGVGITGVAGPGGGTERTPVGRVHLCVSTAAAQRHRRVDLPGDRALVRARTVTIAFHMLRELLLDAQA